MSSEQLFLRQVPFLKQSLLHRSYFFRIAAFSERYLKILLHSISFQNSYFLDNNTFLEKQYSALPTFSGKLLSQSSYFFKRSYFSQQLPFQKSYFFTTYFFKRDTISQLRFLSTATHPIYQLIIKSVRVLSCVSIIADIRIIDKVYLISLLHKVLWNCSFLNKLVFQSLYFLRTPTFSKQLYFFARAAFSDDAVFQNN